MPKATVTFLYLIQDSQDLATENPNESHMLSRAFFTLQTEGRTYQDMSVVLRQPFGTDYATEPLEVEPPKGPYSGNWSHAEFSDAVEDYYRGLIGSQGRMFRLGPGVSNIRMSNNMMRVEKSYEINIPE